MIKQGEKAIYKNLLNKIYIDTLWRDKSVHYRKLKKKLIFRSMTTLKTIAIHNPFAYGSSEGGKGVSHKNIFPFEQTYVESASHPEIPSKKAPKHPTSPNPLQVLIRGG